MKQTHGLEHRLVVTQGEVWEGMDWEVGLADSAIIYGMTDEQQEVLLCRTTFSIL